MDRRAAAFDLVPVRTEFKSSKDHVSKILMKFLNFVAGLPGHISIHVFGTSFTVSQLIWAVDRAVFFKP